MQSPIVNDCLKVKIDCHTEPQLVPKLLLQVSVRELHKILLAKQKMLDSKKQETKKQIIISDSTLHSLLPPQSEKNHHDTRSCVIANVAYLPKVCINHCYTGVISI